MDMEILGFSGLMDDAWVFVRISIFGVWRMTYALLHCSPLSCEYLISGVRMNGAVSTLDFGLSPERVCATVAPCRRWHSQ